MDCVGCAAPGLAPQLLEDLAGCGGRVVSGGHISATLMQFRRQWEKHLCLGEGYEAFPTERESIAVPGHGTDSAPSCAAEVLGG